MDDRYTDDQPLCITIELTAEEIRILKAKIRREEAIRLGTGINRRHNVSKCKKKHLNKTKCRKRVDADE